ncbi:hypothetical protein TNCV_1194501 [Trichonephila clavipes]|nr:hypothetical protein TNCV_1194501 [Trichonephila clavipes]
MFKEGRENIEASPVQVPLQHQEPQKNEQRLRHLLNTDQRLSVPMITEQLGMDKMVVHKIISEDLGMRKICAKLVPKVLTDVKIKTVRPFQKIFWNALKKTLIF